MNRTKSMRRGKGKAVTPYRVDFQGWLRKTERETYMELLNIPSVSTTKPREGSFASGFDAKKISHTPADDFHATFQSWIQKCSNPPEGVDGDTFVDEKGVHRFVESWKSVHHEHSNDIRANLGRTGCIDVPVGLATERTLDSQQTKTADVHTISFLMDFRTLWNHLADDSVDEVAEYSPLFRMYMEIFFHRRVVQFMILVTAYNVAVLAIAEISYPFMDPFHQFLYYLYDILGTVVYLALAILFKGSQVFAAPDITHKTNASDERKDASKRKIMRNRAIDWLVFVKETMRATLTEIHYLCFGRKDGNVPSPHQRRRQQVPFYEALNVGLKFLSQRKISGNKRIVLNPRTNNIKLVFIFLFIPIYCVLWNFLATNGPYTFYMEACQTDGQGSAFCKYFELQFILSLGFLTYIMQKSVYTSAVLLSLVGLHYGAEVGRGLVDSWINRFGMLRRLEYAGQKQLSNSSQGIGRNYPVTELPPQSSKTTRAVSDPVISSLHAPVSTPKIPADAVIPEILVPVAMPELMDYLQRDAYEHYLFIREFMFIGSRAWSPIILTLSFLDTFYVSLFIYGAITAGTEISVIDWIYFTCWVSIRVWLLTIYPIVSLAHANAYVYVLQEQFLVAAPEDFSVLGGRDSWLQYLEKVPAIWTVYGFLVTWDRLTGVLWTALAALGAVAITYASNNV